MIKTLQNEVNEMSMDPDYNQYAYITFEDIALLSKLPDID